MRLQDPLQALSPECASDIFKHLLAPDLACCERVSRRWRIFVQSWIASVGLRLHFQYEVKGLLPVDSYSATCLFKKQAALRANMQRGKPSSVRKYEYTRLFTVAGNFCTWINPDEGIFGQNLSYRKDGSLHKPILLTPVDVTLWHHQPSQLVVLGANGYLLIRSRGDRELEPGKPQNYWDTLYCLQNGNRIWSREYRLESYDDPFWTPLLVGDQRVYYGTVSIGKIERDGGSARMRAHALYSGELLWEAETIAHTADFYGFYDTRGYHDAIPLKLINTNEDELVLVVKSYPWGTNRIASLNIINGADGSLHQKMKADVIGLPSVVTSANGSTFAILSHNEISSIIRIQTFIRQTDSKFDTAHIVMVDPQTSCPFRFMAVDPFADSIVSLVGVQLAPYSSAMVDSLDSDAFSRMEDSLKPILGRHKYNQVLITTKACKITLPPSSKRARLRRKFPVRLSSQRGLELLDSHRVALRCGTHVGTVYLFDFADRMSG